MKTQTLSYASEKVKNSVGLSEIIKLNKEREAINSAIQQFVQYAVRVDGGVSKSWANREKKRIEVVKRIYRDMVHAIGVEDVKKIVATNTISMYFIMNTSEDVIRYHEELKKEYNLESKDDLDLRYYIDSRDYYIFWESILFLMSQDELS
ncbi:MAG: hypothetical protein IBX70_13920 [Clostridia bacterium]|nr:hypothetical protein [Clostridia bacterium]